MESHEIKSVSDLTICSSIAGSQPQHSIKILGEIVGATNLVAALRAENHSGSVIATAASPKSDFVNAFCHVYWGEELIHQTKTISKNNNPIWACDTGSLFSIPLKAGALHNDLKIEVYDRMYDRVGRSKTVLLGVVIIPGENLLDGSICNEKRIQFEMRKDETSCYKKQEVLKLLGDSFLRNLSYVSPVSMPWLQNEPLPQADDEVDESDSIYGNSTNDPSESERANIDDNFIFGKTGTLALRFRVATKEDIRFLKIIDLYNKGYRYAKRKNDRLVAVKNALNGEMLSHFVTEKSTSYVETVNCDLMNEFIDFRIFGQSVDTSGVRLLRVKPGPDPSRPAMETKFLPLATMQRKCYEPSNCWIEAGSGSLGQIKLEILACEGLPNKDFGQMFGKLSDPFVCIIYRDCLVETCVIPDTANPMWMPWTQRAFIFNRADELSSIYLGVFNHKIGPTHHTGCGRVTIDLNEMKSNTIYTLRYELFSSPIMTNRKSKGYITLRLQLTDGNRKTKLLSLVKPRVMHLNVKRRKTLAIARYTCYGKYREDVYNTKILKSYVDELLEYVLSWSFQLNIGILSLIFWRGQVRVWKFHLPLHSFVAFVSATYTIERPHLIPAYLFFCVAWCMLVLMFHQNQHPSPWHRTKSFAHHLGRHTACEFFVKTQGESIQAMQGFEEMNAMHEARKKTMEENKMLKSQIAAVRRELKQILSVVSDVHIGTCEDGGVLNPLSKLLPVQLKIRDVLYIIRCLKMTLDGKNSQLSFLIIISCTAIGILLSVLPIMRVLSWACKLSIWLFLGPWMKLVDMANQRRRPDGKVEKHVKKVMEEIQERERKRWISKRIKREEALKLRSTRIVRFGRFAINVPPANITRFHDYPLPESTAKPAAGLNNDIDISRRIPGQKHSGVMIPELSETKKRTNKMEKKRDVLSKLKSIVDEEKSGTKKGNDTSGSYEVECNIEPRSSFDFGDVSSNYQRKLGKQYSDSFEEQTELVKCSPHLNQATEEGFEMIVKESGSTSGEKIQVWCSNGDKYETNLFEGRDQECSRDERFLDSREFSQRDKCLHDTKRERNAHGMCSMSCEDIDLHLENVMSDITDN